MTLTRRDFLRDAALTATMGTWAASVSRAADNATPNSLIIDTHQHLWDLSWQSPPWLKGAPEILRHDFTTPEYLQATKGLNVKTVYMEVDVAPEDHVAEAEHVIALSRDKAHPTLAAVIGGRPSSANFAGYLDRFRDTPEVKGLRQVLHGGTTPQGYCLQPDFVRGIQLLGERGLSFDLCQRPTELLDGMKLTEQCPDTRFVVDHCGNADPKAFNAKLAPNEARSHTADQWRRDIEQLAKRPNVIGKISGIVARAPQGWQTADLAPIVNHCLDVFGPDRVVFGGDWPVCLLGAKLRGWIDALGEIIAERPAEQQRKLWHANAQAFYKLPR